MLWIGVVLTGVTPAVTAVTAVWMEIFILYLGMTVMAVCRKADSIHKSAKRRAFSQLEAYKVGTVAIIINRTERGTKWS